MDFQQRCLGSLAAFSLWATIAGCSDGAGNSADEPTMRRSSPADGTEEKPGHSAPPPGGGGGEPVEAVDELGLLGSSHARSYMNVFCEGKADDAKLPQDPRELIRPGFNEGKAVAFNAYYQDCQGAPGPQTCGEYRAQRAAGQKLVQRDLAVNYFGVLMPAALYSNSWKGWDGPKASERPANFDAQARERFGLPEAPFDNPYPLPGEDPNATDGGSGQLPLGMLQLRDQDGKWTGTISITCEICHSGSVRALGELGGAAYVPGMGANTSDLQLLFSDLAFPMPIGMNDSPGVTNAMGLSGMIIGAIDQDSLGARLDTAVLMQIPGNTSGSGDTKAPPWWNASHRPRKFWDGGYSQDAKRLDSAILHVLKILEKPLGKDKEHNQAVRDTIENDSLVIQTYIESLTSPLYPWPVDEPLAEQGSVLFHSFDLWGHGANADIPRPPTNGSCAGCHGAYAPRFVNDPSFLEDPRLEGMAGYIAPLEIIRTDPERFKGFTKPLLEMMSTSWYSYPESAPGYVPPEAKSQREEFEDDHGIFKPGTRARGACTWQGGVEGDAVGYLAPPLHGIWATGPYLHNASLPDIWSVLDPDHRPAFWRRQLTQGEGTEHGQDTGATAYDTARLGWKYESLVCGEGSAASGEEYVDCEPTNPTHPYEEIGDFVKNWSGSLNSLGYQVRQPTNRKQVELRKIFNTHRFAKGNGGHDFTRALTDPQRKAIVEYLKTL